MSDTPKLSERAMLVNLVVGQWSGTATDKQVTDEVIEQKHAEKGAGRWTKQLIARKFLNNPSTKISALRATHRQLTLPWEDSGCRILSAVAHLTYTQEIQRGKAALEAAVNSTFDEEKLKEYKDEAKFRLGDTYDEEAYLTVEEIKAKYYCDVEIRPIPEAGDFRTKLSDKTVKAVMKDIEKRTEERLEKATRDIYQRIVDVCDRMVERLHAYEPGAGSEESSNRFRDSLIWNVQELTNLLPILNVAGDPKIDEMHQKLVALSANSPQVLRLDPQIRKSTVSQAEKILAKAKAYLG